MENIILNFIPSDFEGNFIRDCAIEKAAKRQLGWENPSVGTCYIHNGDTNSYTIINPTFNNLSMGVEGFESDKYYAIKNAIKENNFQSASVELGPNSIFY